MAIFPFGAGPEQWRGAFMAQGPDLPIDFLLKWLQSESGGNVCSEGIKGVEAGIFQTYHPADDRFGATFQQLRAGCSGQSIVDPSLVNRDLQASHGLNFVRSKRDTARMHLNLAGSRWDESSSDFWKMVKLEHALPCIPGELLFKVATKIGRGPANWDEFRRGVMAMAPAEMGVGCRNFRNSPSRKGLAHRLEDTLSNAEEVGKYGGGVLGTIGTVTAAIQKDLGAYAPLVLIGAAGVVFYMLWRE